MSEDYDGWRDNYDTRYGVDSSDYASEDDFLSARMSSQRDLERMRASAKKQEGCYIATCVYGSYDCSEVLVLRHFRDRVLKASAPGRAFIRCYYALSPRLVARFGGQKWFHDLCRRPLDLWVRYLQKRSYR